VAIFLGGEDEMRSFLINLYVGIPGAIVGYQIATELLGASPWSFGLGVVVGAGGAMQLFSWCRGRRDESLRSLFLWLLGVILGTGAILPVLDAQRGVILLNTRSTDALVYPVQSEKRPVAVVDLSFIGFSATFAERYNTDKALISTSPTEFDYTQIAARTHGQTLRCSLTVGLPRRLLGTFLPPDTMRTRIELPLSAEAKAKLREARSSGVAHPVFELNPSDLDLQPSWIRLYHEDTPGGQEQEELPAPVNFIRTPLHSDTVFIQWHDHCSVWLDALRRESLGVMLQIADQERKPLQVPAELQQGMAAALCKLPATNCPVRPTRAP
jgi:hypothetical protein